MNNKPIIKLPFCNAWINLSAQAMAYLTESTGGTSNFKLFYLLLTRMQLEETVVVIRGIEVKIGPGQVNAPKNSLQKEWGVNRKSIGSFFDKLEELNVISQHSNRVTTIIDMRCVFSWANDVERAKNILFRPLDDKPVRDAKDDAKRS